jgi:nucleoside diphosphate kinase
MKIFNRKAKASKSLYTQSEEKEIKELLKGEYTEEIAKRIYDLQLIQCNREIRIIKGKTTAEDAKQGMTRKEFPWLAKFNN